MIEASHLILATAGTPESSASWWETIQAGGPVAYLILLLSTGALALIIMHLLQIRRSALLPAHQLEALDAMLAQGDVNAAIEYSLSPENDSYLTRILGSGLTRFQRSAFGAFEIKNAIEEAGEDQTARLYRSTDALGVIGAISPLLGLLGTVLGMVGAFQSLSLGGQQSDELAGSISMALVTTLLGLILAIPCIALFTFFRNRIDTFASEAGIEIERLVLHLESMGAGGRPSAPAAPGRPGPAARPSPSPSPNPAVTAPTGPTDA